MWRARASRYASYAMPLAAAAAVFFAWQVRAARHAQQGRPLADILAEHSSQLPPDTQPANVRGLAKYVGVPVHAPAMRLREQNATLVGARVTAVNNERGAMLQYEVATPGSRTFVGAQPVSAGGADPQARDMQGAGQPLPPVQRVSVFVYDPRKIQVDDANLSPRAVGTTQVRMGRANGYSVAMAERDGVGYVVTSDLDPEVNAQLIGNFE
jgi:hypothetical protein